MRVLWSVAIGERSRLKPLLREEASRGLRRSYRGVLDLLDDRFCGLALSVAYGDAHQSDLSNVDSTNNPNASASNQNAFGAAMLK